jgi:hypothetical protein
MTPRARISPPMKRPKSPNKVGLFKNFDCT